MTARTQGWQRAWQRVSRPPRTVDESNDRLLYREIAWYGILNGIAGTFTSVFAIRLGASNQLLGLLVSLPALIGITLQLPAARLVERQPRLLRIMVISFLLNRLGYLAIAILPWLVVMGRAQALVGVITLMAIPLTVANIAFIAMMAEVVPPERRARVVSIRNMLIALTTTITVLITGRALDLFRFPINYQGAFLIAFAASMLSLIDLTRLRIPGDEPAQGRPVAPALPWRGLLRQQRYARFVVAAFVVNFALSIPAALYPLYRVRSLQASDTWIGLIGTIETGVAVLAAYYWGRQVARRGNQVVALLALLGFAFYPLFTALSTRLEPLLFIAIIGGVCNPAFSIGMFSLLLEVCPAAGRPTYIGLYSMLVNAAAFAGPLLGTTMADGLSIRAALLISAALRLCAAGFFLLWIRSDQRLSAAGKKPAILVE